MGFPFLHFFPALGRNGVSRLVPGVTLPAFAFCVLTLAAEVRPGERCCPAICERRTCCTATGLSVTSLLSCTPSPHPLLLFFFPHQFITPLLSFHFCFLSLSLRPTSAPSLSPSPSFHLMALSLSLSALLRSLIGLLAFSLRCLYDQ